MLTSRQLGEVVRFAIAGLIGFCVDVVILVGLVAAFRMDPLVAKVCSFVVALQVTWLINRSWAFRRRRDGRPMSLREFGTYLAVQLTGAAINYAAFALALFTSPFTGYTALILAAAVGVAAGMLVNFSGNKWIVFRRSPRTEQSQ